MPKGIPKDWTLAELQMIWEFDGSEGQTVEDLAYSLKITRSTYYSLRARLQNAGGPQQLFDKMQVSGRGRYNRASAGKRRYLPRGRDTVAQALGRVYYIRISNNGRDGTQAQYTITIPPSIASPFVGKHGRFITFEPREDGILIKPLAPGPLPEGSPSWLTP